MLLVFVVGGTLGVLSVTLISSSSLKALAFGCVLVLEIGIQLVLLSKSRSN